MTSLGFFFLLIVTLKKSTVFFLLHLFWFVIWTRWLNERQEAPHPSNSFSDSGWQMLLRSLQMLSVICVSCLCVFLARPCHFLQLLRPKSEKWLYFRSSDETLQQNPPSSSSSLSQLIYCCFPVAWPDAHIFYLSFFFFLIFQNNPALFLAKLITPHPAVELL